MIRSIYRASDGQVRTGLDSAEYGKAKADPGGLLWLDLSEEPVENCEPLLLETFGFHPLAVDDALKQTHNPKIDDWDDYLCIVLHAVAVAPSASGGIKTLELDLFLGAGYLVTYRSQPIVAVDTLWEDCQRDSRHLRKGEARLLYELMDRLASDYMLVVEQFDEAIDRIESQIFSNPGTEVLEQLFSLKRGLVHVRRIIAPQREVLNKLARGDYAMIQDEEQDFFRDVYDHLVRLHDITESLRDLAAGALDTYLSVVNNRMNDIMKTLTIITTLFMPISFLTGFFGMNFFEASGLFGSWTQTPAFVVALVIMSLLPATMLIWIRKRAWQ